MKINIWVMSLALSLAIVASAHAQGGGGRGGRGGGPGGFRGMPGGRSLVALASNEAVQKDVGISSEVAAKLKTMSETMRDDMNEARQGLGDFREMSDSEREKAMEKMTEIAKSMNEKYTPKLKDLLTADQFTRVQQIHWQELGTSAYSEPEIVKALAIAKDQQDKIKSINTQTDSKRRELFREGGGGGGRNEGMIEKMMEINKERDAKVNEVLTKDQLDKFAMLKGKEFDLDQIRGGRGPGGRGPGGNGGGDNNSSNSGTGKGKRPQPKAE